jgi:hypothetical protein
MVTSSRNLEEQKYKIHCCFRHCKFHMKILRTEPNERPASNCLTHGKAVTNSLYNVCKFTVKDQYCAHLS